jgi:hypothetical protein
MFPIRELNSVRLGDFFAPPQLITTKIQGVAVIRRPGHSSVNCKTTRRARTHCPKYYFQSGKRWDKENT